MATEDRTHRSHKLNPRRHPIGPEGYSNPSASKIWEKMGRDALLSEAEQKFIQDVPRHHGDGNYANLGHEKGGSAILLANGLWEYKLTGKVFTVDLVFEKGCDARMEKWGVTPYIKECKGSTNEWAEHLRELTFKFVFIDADHTYGAVVSDFIRWSPLVEVGGWVAFHDSNQDFSHRAINDIVTKEWVERKDLHVHRIRTFQKEEGTCEE